MSYNNDSHNKLVNHIINFHYNILNDNTFTCPQTDFFFFYRNVNSLNIIMLEDKTIIFNSHHNYISSMNSF